MKLFVIALTAMSAACLVAGCGAKEPDEKQLHQILGAPPQRPKSRGVGQKRLEEKGAVPPSSAPGAGS